MGHLLQLAAEILAGSGKALGIRTAAIRMAAAVLCSGLAAALLLAALGCTATALWLFALPSLSPVGAALVVAAGLSILTLIFGAAVWFIMHRGAPRQRNGVAGFPLQFEATRLFGAHKGALLLAAAIAGMAAANRSRRP